MRYSDESSQADSSSAKGQSVPPVTVVGTVRRLRKPSKVAVSVSVEAESRSREDALDELARKLKKIEKIAEKYGDSLMVRTNTPDEQTIDKEKMLRTVENIRFYVHVGLDLFDSDRLGELMVDLMNEKFQFQRPHFEHDKVTGFTQTEHEEAARQARHIAEALAVGSGCKLGAVLKIRLPDLKVDQYQVKLRDWGGWRGFALPHIQYNRWMPTEERNDVFESMLGTAIPEYADVLTVEVTYQLLS
jgi:hypothetical protein